MQLKPVVRVITVILVSAGMLSAVAIATPPSLVWGNEYTGITTKQFIHNPASSSSFVIIPVSITDTTSTTPTIAITDTAVMTATTGPTAGLDITPTSTSTMPTLTPTPTEEPTVIASLTPEPTASKAAAEITPTPEAEQDVISFFTNLVRTQPLIPLGFVFVILVSALALILIAAQRKIKHKPLPQRVEGSTAPLLPKVTPAHERAFLRLKNHPEISFPLVIDDVRIGRSPDNTIVITPEMQGAETVSRYHARLYRLERWVLEDLDSTNGVYVNGQRTGRNYLRSGWEIGIGGVTFTFHTGKAEA